MNNAYTYTINPLNNPAVLIDYKTKNYTVSTQQPGTIQGELRVTNFVPSDGQTTFPILAGSVIVGFYVNGLLQVNNYITSGANLIADFPTFSDSIITIISR